MAALPNSKITSINTIYASTGSYTVTVPINTSSIIGSWSNSNISISSPPTSTGEIKVSGDAHFDGEIYVKGKSLAEFMSTIEDRLAILQPDPEMLEKFEALKKAYEHYKLLEKLCQSPNKGKEK